MNWTNVSFPETLLVHPTWNFLDISKARTAKQCFRKFFWRYVLGWEKEEQDVDTYYGKLLHDAVGFLQLNGYDKVEGAFRRFEKEWRKFFSEEWDEITSPKNPKRLKEGLEIWAGQNWADQERYEILGVERGGVVPISKLYELTYRLDSECRDRENDKVVIFERKTSKTFSDFWIRQWEMDFQVGGYYHVGNWKYGIEVFDKAVIDGFFFRKVKDDSKGVRFENYRQDAIRTSQQCQVWLGAMRRIFELVEREFELLSKCEVDEPVLRAFWPDSDRCNDFVGNTGREGCPYKDFCNYWTNPLQHCKEVPSGFVRKWWSPLGEE